jgi:D-3-phosphoglycerate dehydrogenase
MGLKVLLGPSTFAAQDRAPVELLESSGLEVQDNPFKRRLTKEELLELLPGVDGLVAGLEPLSRDVMEASDLKVISRCGAGMVNVDQEAAADLGIRVFNTPDAPTDAVAELTVGALLSLLRSIPQMDARLHAGEWDKRIGTQLRGKTVAVVGFGRIGRAVARLLAPFGARIIAVDPALSGEAEGFEVVSMDDALAQADVVSLHASGESALLGSDEFARLKSGAYVLNAARGGVVDEDALAVALDDGRVAGAWLDVFSAEPYEGPLASYDQVVMTPHVGSYTTECRSCMEMESVQNLLRGFEEAGLR